MSKPTTMTAVFTPEENGWTMAQLAERPAVVTCGRTVDEQITIDLAAQWSAARSSDTSPITAARN